MKSSLSIKKCLKENSLRDGLITAKRGHIICILGLLGTYWWKLLVLSFCSINISYIILMRVYYLIAWSKILVLILLHQISTIKFKVFSVLLQAKFIKNPNLFNIRERQSDYNIYVHYQKVISIHSEQGITSLWEWDGLQFYKI